jgi:exopolysaccharide biosynthesis protein
MKIRLRPIIALLLILSQAGFGISCSTGGSAATAGSATGTETTYSDSTSSTTNAESTSDMTYTSSSTSISITKVTTGSGDNSLVYYVADVQLAAGSTLDTGLSSGTFEGKAQDTSSIAEESNAVFAVNGDYYSARDDGIIIRNGVLYRNIPAREGLAIYKDGTMKVYDETEVSADQLLADGVWNTFSFGPILLDQGDIPDGLDTYEPVSNAKHPIQGSQPRTGIGIIDANHFVFVVVDGRSSSSTGVTLEEFAEIFKSLGCTTAYNLDGGGSSTMYFQGQIVNSPLGKENERAVSDIIMVK